MQQVTAATPFPAKQARSMRGESPTDAYNAAGARQGGCVANQQTQSGAETAAHTPLLGPTGAARARRRKVQASWQAPIQGAVGWNGSLCAVRRTPACIDRPPKAHSPIVYTCLVERNRALRKPISSLQQEGLVVLVPPSWLDERLHKSGPTWGAGRCRCQAAPQPSVSRRAGCVLHRRVRLVAAIAALWLGTVPPCTRQRLTQSWAACPEYGAVVCDVAACHAKRQSKLPTPPRTRTPC